MRRAAPHPPTALLRYQARPSPSRGSACIRDVKDRLLALRGHEEADRRLGLLDAVGDEAGGAGEDRYGANEARRNVDVAQRRRDGHRHVHRQRLAPDLGRGLLERQRRLDRASGDAPLARQTRPCARRAGLEAYAADGRSRGGLCARRDARARPRARPRSSDPQASARASTSSMSLRQRSAAPRITVPQPSTPAAIAP